MIWSDRMLLSKARRKDPVFCRRFEFSATARRQPSSSALSSSNSTAWIDSRRRLCETAASARASNLASAGPWFEILSMAYGKRSRSTQQKRLASPPVNPRHDARVPCKSSSTEVLHGSLPEKESTYTQRHGSQTPPSTGGRERTNGLRRRSDLALDLRLVTTMASTTTPRPGALLSEIFFATFARTTHVYVDAQAAERGFIPLDSKDGLVHKVVKSFLQSHVRGHQSHCNSVFNDSGSTGDPVNLVLHPRQHLAAERGDHERHNGPSITRFAENSAQQVRECPMRATQAIARRASGLGEARSPPILEIRLRG
eukprot:scaffold878_cov271-Pinguiococcus_pyrenoidosus.AAC.6